MSVKKVAKAGVIGASGLAVIAGGVGTASAYNDPQNFTTPHYEDSVDSKAELVAHNAAAEIFNLINSARTAAGLNALIPTVELDDVADARAVELDTDYRHNGVTSKMPSNYQRVGEIIFQYPKAFNTKTGKIGHNQTLLGKYSFGAYMDSPPHKSIIMNPDFTHFGVGTYVGDKTGNYSNAVVFAQYSDAVVESGLHVTPTDAPTVLSWEGVSSGTATGGGGDIKVDTSKLPATAPVTVTTPDAPAAKPAPDTKPEVEKPAPETKAPEAAKPVPETKPEAESKPEVAKPAPESKSEAEKPAPEVEKPAPEVEKPASAPEKPVESAPQDEGIDEDALTDEEIRTLEETSNPYDGMPGDKDDTPIRTESKDKVVNKPVSSVSPEKSSTSTVVKSTKNTSGTSKLVEVGGERDLAHDPDSRVEPKLEKPANPVPDIGSEESTAPKAKVRSLSSKVSAKSVEVGGERDLAYDASYRKEAVHTKVDNPVPDISSEDPETVKEWTADDPNAGVGAGSSSVTVDEDIVWVKAS